MVNAIINFGVRVARPFCSEFKDRPLIAMLVVEKLDELICGIAVGFLRPDRARARGHNNCKL